LLKQSPASVDRVQKAFYLSDGERNYLLSAGVGEGLFFAGANHVGIQVVASKAEHRLISTNPAELKRLEQELVEMNQLDAKTQLKKDSEITDSFIKVGQALGDEKIKISAKNEANEKAG
jgi:hypothetical protein